MRCFLVELNHPFRNVRVGMTASVARWYRANIRAKYFIARRRYARASLPLIRSTRGS